MTLGWVSIARLGVVQMALGSIVVLTTSTLNRLMVVELALPAVLPGLLVALHYGIQITRPNWGFLSDAGGHRTRWIIGGMGVLALGALGATAGVMLFETSFAAGLALSILAYALIGLGAGASGTSLLALLASATEPRRRAAAATITWLMMIFGIAATASTVGAFLDPYSPALLLRIVGVVTGAALLATVLAVRGIEARVQATRRPPSTTSFLNGMREIWAEPAARNFSIFVFLSMTAYFMQELILEPFAGLVFGMTPGQTTTLSGAQNGGVFLGMLTVGVAATGFGFGSLRAWVVAGCLGSAGSLGLITALGGAGIAAGVMPAVVSLGFFNGMFAVAAIGSMMALAGQGRGAREGTRMGVWGAAQAIAAGFGGLLGAGAVDLMRLALANDAQAFGAVFLAEATLFILAALLALRVIQHSGRQVAAAVPGE
ncbi:BCD family MFS transporter [Roseovarius sp. D22-M7]|uniref:BCD family MFS transporter n=1 Tax=Roseovarius sp. D22-M7 TaxID=3127116 RepID=UPI00300FA5CC